MNLFRKKTVILIIEAVILIGVITGFLIELSRGDDYADTGIRISDLQSSFTSYDDGWHFEEGIGGTEEDPVNVLYGPFIYLKRGYYTLTLTYGCDNEQEVEPYAGDGNEAYIDTNVIELDPLLHTMTYDLRIKEPIEKFEIISQWGRFSLTYFGK